MLAAARPLHFVIPMTSLSAAQLAIVSGGWRYAHHNETGERWAAKVDSAYKSIYDAVSPYAGKNVTGLSLLPSMAVYEWSARRAGWVWEHTRG